MPTRVLLLLAILAIGNVAPADAAPPPHSVVVIPGILGSQLCSGDEVLWGNSNSLRNLAKLELDQADNSRIHPCGIIKNVQILGPVFVSHFYDGLLSELRRLGYVENKDLFIFDYDWRRSNLENAKALKASIAEKVPRDKPYDIIAHSMGGIVAKLALADDSLRRPNRVIYLGTPFLGSANALGTLSEGWGPFKNTLAGGMDTIRRIVLSWPGFIELLPRYEGSCRLKLADSTYRSLNPLAIATWTDYGWLPPQLRSGSRFEAFRSALERSATLTKALLADPPDGVTEVFFAGEGHLTRHRLGILIGSTNPSPENWKFREEPGDGTVAEWSAARDMSQTTVASALPSFNQHSTLFDDKWVQTEISRLLTQTAPTSDEPISSRGPPTIVARKDGKEYLWTVDGVELVTSAPTATSSEEISAVLTVRIKNGRVVAGAFSPRIVSRSKRGEVPLEVRDITTVQDLKEQQLRYSARTLADSPGEVIEIAAEIAESLSASANVLVLD